MLYFRKERSKRGSKCWVGVFRKIGWVSSKMDGRRLDAIETKSGPYSGTQ